MISFSCKYLRTKAQSNEHGFTLVELMVTLAMSGIIVAAVYAAYSLQQKTYYTQGQVVEMQQNLRAALEMLLGDIRMAAFDPDGDAGAGIKVATASQIQVQMDLNDDGDSTDSNEDITYGIAGNTLTRTLASGGGAQPIAENIEAIDFYYTLADGTKEVNPTATGKEDDIQSVTISILAVAEQRDGKYTNNLLYNVRTVTNSKTWGPFNDNFRRRLLISTVNIRNQGL